jgi:hypothetical protein
MSGSPILAQRLFQKDIVSCGDEDVIREKGYIKVVVVS